LIFNKSGLKFPGLDTDQYYPQLLSSKSASLEKDGWRLKDGYLIGLDSGGEVNYSMEFDQLKVKMSREIANLVFESRKTNEMGIKELWIRSQAARKAGRAGDELTFAFHSRISQPLAGLVFVLFSAPLSLLLRHRSKAVGILLALVSVGGYQGVLLWAKSSVRRTGLNPVLGAWLPDAIFGLLGLLLFLLLDSERLTTYASKLKPIRHLES